MNLKKPYVLFLGAATDLKDVKTATGVAIWSPHDAVAECALEACTVTVGLPRAHTPAEAAQLGARTLVIGCVSPGGGVDFAWLPVIQSYIEAGFDVACGMHDRLNDMDTLKSLAQQHSVQLVDFRYPTQKYPLGNGRKRKGLRLLTVGHDSNCGKKYTALALHRHCQQVGIATKFCATGQTGLLIAGEDDRVIVNDTTRADFLSGAAEWLSPDAEDAGLWYLIEGQGSIWHPSFAGGSLSLLMGSQPDLLVLCVDPTREKMRGTNYAPVDVEREIEANIMFARRTNIHCAMAGISVNLSGVHPMLHAQTLAQYARYGFQVFDPNDPTTFAHVVRMMRQMAEEAR